jgi:hypothetical protein
MMELLMPQSNMTMHQLGMVQEQPGLTHHRVRSSRRRTSSAKVAVVPDGVTCPKVGTVVQINPSVIVSEGDNGEPKTPMIKLGYDSRKKMWTQVGASLAGMLAFFEAGTEPNENTTKVRVARVIPSGRACYVVPA